MRAPTDDEMHALIAQKVAFYKRKNLTNKSTSDFALSEVQETDNSGSLHLTGSNKPSSTQTENHKYVQGQLFSDNDPVSKKLVSRDNEESRPRSHHGQEFVEAGKSVAELQCYEISKCQSNRPDSDQSLRYRRANLPASQPEATVTQYPSDVEVSACWLKLKPKDWEEDDTSPGMNEGHTYSDGSCETEDSCDYSSGPEDYKASFTPLRRRLLQEAANPFEDKNEDEVATVQKGHNSSCLQRLKELDVAENLSEDQRNGKRISNESSVITIDSDSEDEYVASSLVSSSGLDCSGDPEGVEQRRQNYLLTDVIVIDSDAEDSGDQSIEESTTERASSSVGEENVVLVMPHQDGQRGNETANAVPSADLRQPKLQNTPEDIPKDKLEGARCDSVHGAQPGEPKDACDKVENKIAGSEAFGRTKNVTSRSKSGDDSRQSTPSSTKNRESREMELQSEKCKVSSANSVKTLPRGIPPPTTGFKKTDASEKSRHRFGQKKKGEHLSKLKLGNPPKPSVDKNLEKEAIQSKHLSPTTKRDLSISTCRSILSSRKSCEDRQSSPSAEGSPQSEGATGTNCNEIKCKTVKRVTFDPRPHSPFKRLARSTSAPSASETPATSAFGHQVISPKSFLPCAATKSSPRMKVLEDWRKTHYPIRFERKWHHGAEQNMETANCTTESSNHTLNTDSEGPARPELAQHSEVTRQRRRSQDSNTSLMKRCKNEAIVWSKAIHRQPAKTKSGSFQSLI